MKQLAAGILILLATAFPARAGEITVFAAASLTNVLTTMQADFEKTHPGDSLKLVFAASGALLSRMEGGESCDVLISADADTINTAIDKHRVVAATRVPFAGNTLVLAVPAGNPAHVTDLETLSQGGVRRIGVGNPDSVPAGRYAKRALQRKALWFALTSKLVYYPSVRHVLAALKSGDLDAGFVYATDASIAGKAVDVAADIPLSPSIAYIAALATSAKNQQDATAFLNYLVTPEAGAVLSHFGFAAP